MLKGKKPTREQVLVSCVVGVALCPLFGFYFLVIKKSVFIVFVDVDVQEEIPETKQPLGII